MHTYVNTDFRLTLNATTWVEYVVWIRTHVYTTHIFLCLLLYMYFVSFIWVIFPFTYGNTKIKNKLSYTQTKYRPELKQKNSFKTKKTFWMHFISMYAYVEYSPPANAGTIFTRTKSNIMEKLISLFCLFRCVGVLGSGILFFFWQVNAPINWFSVHQHSLTFETMKLEWDRIFIRWMTKTKDVFFLFIFRIQTHMVDDIGWKSQHFFLKKKKFYQFNFYFLRCKSILFKYTEWKWDFFVVKKI